MTDITYQQQGEVQLCPTKDLMEAVGLARSSFYGRLKALGINPKKHQGQSFITKPDVKLFLEAHEYVTQGNGTIDLFLAQRNSAAIVKAEAAELAITEEKIAEEFDPARTRETYQLLHEAAERGYQFPTSLVAQALGVTPSTVLQRREGFDAYGFRFTPTGGVWNREKQWAIAKA